MQGSGAGVAVRAIDSVLWQESLVRGMEEAVLKVSRFLLRLQSPEGWWCGELEADTTLESDSVKMWHLLGRVDPQKQERLLRTILKKQLPDGGWPIYAFGPSELNASVKAYVALRLAGRPAEDPVLQRARGAVLRLGGLERINSFEKVYLALFGLYPWDQVPALPPEVVLLPNGFPVNLHEVSCWSRTILVPLAVLCALRPAWKEAGFTLDELWQDPLRKRARITNFQKGGLAWRRFFLAVNWLLQRHERLPWKPFRRLALRRADEWINQRLLESDGLGAIFPAMINAVFALKALGYGDGDPLLERSVREMERLELADGEALKVQPCFSPVWDTALCVYILGKTRGKTVPFPGVPGSQPNPSLPEMVPGLGPALENALGWLKENEVRVWGDWKVKNPRGKPGGWAFQFRNPFYPDVDDTAQVLLGFQAVRGQPGAYGEEAFKRGLEWLLSMQNRDGGWSSYDRNNDRAVLNHFPFADHNAMLDPSACDITGRVLELLAAAGLERGHPAVDGAVAFLLRSQEPDGTWFGRWGVNYIYGSWLALRGLKSVGERMDEVRYQRAGQWLLRHQNPDGGWGESCRSYDDPSTKGQGPSTPSQTAWALMALMALERSALGEAPPRASAQRLALAEAPPRASAQKVAEPAFRGGLEYLLKTQREDGNWEEESFTGTGFPRVFYLRYDLYRTSFPLLALIEAREFFTVISRPEAEKSRDFSSLRSSK